MRRVKGSTRLAFATFETITDLVERTHGTTASKVFRPLTNATPTAAVARRVEAVHDATAAGVYTLIRGLGRGAEKLVDLGFELQGGGSARRGSKASTDREAPESPAAVPAKASLADHAESAVNALYGDHLHRGRNPLDLGMSLRRHGKPLATEGQALKEALPEASGKIVLFVHGLACTEWIWNISAEAFYGDPQVSFGSRLESELGYAPLYLRYNSGRHISENGRLLSELLTRLIAAYPREVEEIVLVGHSMGGLVARSAAHYGAKAEAEWIGRLRHLVCLGTPHLGSPLEKGVNVLASLLGAFDTAGTQVPAELLEARSAGIKDLRFGYTTDEEWQGKDPDGVLDDNRQDLPLVDGVGYIAIAASVTRDPEHPLGALLGDLLVRLPSAAGRAPEPTRSIPFQSERVLTGMSHLDLANHPEVYRVLKGYL
ncbi:MAG: alpha/beta fold hydrolase [Kiloniellales bacterium]|nr:alpha/beta fold hydrolase [Kiloniellales bacterium]